MKTFSRLFLSVLVLTCGAALAFVALSGPVAKPKIVRLAYERPTLTRPPLATDAGLPSAAAPEGVAIAPAIFGHPVISGIQGVGFEQDLRLDPSNPTRVYTSAPGSESSLTSWIWHSTDTGRTFKWVSAATPYEGKPTPPCAGGGDSELGVDIMGRIYFCDLTLANFSVARSDDLGATFPCSNTGVPDAVVDRQWYAFDGDPLNGGSIYLTNDEVAQAPASCGATTNLGQNILVMYRSPVTSNAATTAGLVFGPANRVSNQLGCDEGIMGNNEVSPIATTLGQTDGMGGYATLPTPVKHIFVIHDNALLNQLRLGRCFPVAFGAPAANVSDPSGLNCVDLLVADLGPNAKTGGSFPTMAIDKAGNLYAVWEQAPLDANGMINGDTVLKYSYSTDQGNTWAAPATVPTAGSSVGPLHTNVFAWIAAGDDGRVGIAWYGTAGAPTFPSNGPDSCGANCDWSLWYLQITNAHSQFPLFTSPTQASEHFIHRGSIQTVMGGQNGDRTLGDFLQLRIGAKGEAEISYADSNNQDEASAPHGMFVRQNGGPTLLSTPSSINLIGLKPFNSVMDPSGDGLYEQSGVTSANMPQLDILQSSVSLWTAAPCSIGAPCYRVTMVLNNLSLAPTTTTDPDTDLVWSTQWLVPSSSDTAGGKNFHVYAESTAGGALTCYYGENAEMAVGGGIALTYPGTAALPAANCQSTLGPNGSIVIYVPLANVPEAGAIDGKLREVTASTMTLQGPANSVPPVGGIGGSLFNVIDVAQSYVFDPAQITALSVVSRKQHGTAGTFDIPIAQNGPSLTECRSGGPNGNYQLVVSYANPISAVGGASLTSGSGSVNSFSISGSQVTINLTGITNPEIIVVTLTGMNDGTTSNATSSITFPVLVGDTNGDGTVNSGDATQTRNVSGQTANAANFRNDTNTDGVINSADATQVRNNSGSSLNQ